MMNLKDIGNAALALPPDQRKLLAEVLLASLEHPIEIKHREEWERESETRLDAYDRGEMKSYSREEAMMLGRDS